MVDAERILGHSSRLFGNDLQFEGVVWVESTELHETEGGRERGSRARGGDTLCSWWLHGLPVGCKPASCNAGSTGHHHRTGAWEGGQAPSE